MRIAVIILLTTLATALSYEINDPKPHLPGTRRLRGESKLAMDTIRSLFNADIAIPAALKHEHGRHLEVSCNVMGGDVVCTGFPAEGFTTTFTDCPANPQSPLDCGQCTIGAGSDECTSCTVCASGSDPPVGWDCANIATGTGVVTQCADRADPDPTPADPTDPSEPTTPGGNPTGLSCVFTYD